MTVAVSSFLFSVFMCGFATEKKVTENRAIYSQARENQTIPGISYLPLAGLLFAPLQTLRPMPHSRWAGGMLSIFGYAELRSTYNAFFGQ